MKKGFYILILIIISTIFIGSLKNISSKQELNTKAKLSDWAEEVTSIHIKDKENIEVNKIHDIKKEGKSLFFICNNTLYKYSNKGEYVCTINDTNMSVASYIIDKDNQEIILLGDVNDICYYSFNGQLLRKKKIETKGILHNICAIAYYKSNIYTVEEVSTSMLATGEIHIKKQVVKYNTDFVPQKIYSLDVPNQYKERQKTLPLHPQLAVYNNTIYTYASPVCSHHLLKDTLQMVACYEKGELQLSPQLCLPMQLGNRFCFNQYRKAKKCSANYQFMFDRTRQKSWLLEEGIYDDFNHTGVILSFEVMDLQHSYYSYTKEDMLYFAKLKA